MKLGRSDIKISESEAYEIDKYDNVYVVLNGFNELWKDRIKYSSKKQKYFLHGRIIKWLIMSEGNQFAIKGYPLKGSVSFVDHKDWQMYITTKWNKVKEEKILHIHYSWIDYIVLDFKALDWKH